MRPASVVLIGTCDSKLDELLLLRQAILSHGASSVTLVDVGRTPTSDPSITISREEVISFAPNDRQGVDPASLPRGELIKHMSLCATACVQFLHADGKISGIISAGGSGGTSLVAPVMRALPIGFPKLIVSTVASGDTGPIIGETDITMMYSVVDIAGSNTLLQRVFQNAAGAIVGMSKAYWEAEAAPKTEFATRKKRIGLTMFGVTTPCVDAARAELEKKHGCECYVFHATGHGGLAMERLVQAGELDAVLDLTTTEIGDHLMGGNMSAGPDRLDASLSAGIPCVISLGATDMVNFGPRATVPEVYQKRQLYEHNPTVTLMRTSKDECRRIGEFIVGKIQQKAVNKSKVIVVLPMGGVSMIATPGAPFEDQEADRATFEAIREGLKNSGIAVLDDARAINDQGFAQDVAALLAGLL